MANNRIQNKRSDTEGKVPTVDDLTLGELAVNTFDGKMFLKTEQSGEQAIIEFANSVPIENMYYVKKSGDDTNSGQTFDDAFATIERALEVANGRTDPTVITVGPGKYETEGNLDMPPSCVIRCIYRTVTVNPKPGFEVNNVFRMSSNCFIEGFLFEGWQLDSLVNPTKGFAVCFRPDAIITRAPYIHKVGVRTNPYWGQVPPPLDRENANPLVGVGAGVALADGAVCSPYSIYPNIMTWGATPVSHNGIGYCAKNGALINAVNAISLWAHKHFLAQSGGQIVLSACSTQFGDYTMIAEGSRQLIYPYSVDPTTTLTVETTSSNEVDSYRNTIINNMWNSLVSNGYTTGWNAEDEEFTRRDANTFLQSMIWVLASANEKPMLDFAKGLFDVDGSYTFSTDKLNAFIYSFEFMRDEINTLPNMSTAATNYVTELVAKLKQTLNSPEKRSEPSVITAIGHTWTGVFAGVALTKVPPVNTRARIEDSISEIDDGRVVASGQDDRGSALFIGGLKIDADTGELTGPPFDQAVNRIATRASIARSY